MPITTTDSIKHGNGQTCSECGERKPVMLLRGALHICLDCDLRHDVTVAEVKPEPPKDA
jgi:hypothetical protein